MTEQMLSPAETAQTASIGRHHHLNVDQRLKTETRALYHGVLGGKPRRVLADEVVGGALPSDVEVEAFTFNGGASIACFYVPTEQAPTPLLHVQAVWLEFEVDDVAQTTTALEKLGIAPVEPPLAVLAGPYFQAPGGQVFRLAERH